jgi:hypothetical protein
MTLCFPVATASFALVLVHNRM